MTDIQSRLSDLNQKISEAQIKKTRAEVAYEQAEAKLAELREILKTKFKVESLSDAEALKAKMASAIEKKLEQAEEELQEIK